MIRYISRKGSVRAVEGNYPSSQSPIVKDLVWHYIVPRAMLKADKAVQSVHKLATGSITISLPPNYTDASVLFVRIKTNAKIKITTVSPVRGSRAVIVAGSSAVPGYFQIQERITSITIKYLAASADVTAFAFQLPELSVSTNFKGVTG